MENFVKEALKRLEEELGHSPKAMEMERMFGGSANAWGRILKDCTGALTLDYKIKLEVIAKNGSKNFWSNLGKYQIQIRRKR